MPENYTPKTDWQKNDIVSEHDFNRIEQGLVDAHNPNYIPQTSQAQIFNPPAGSVDGFVKGMEIRGMSLFNSFPDGALNSGSGWAAIGASFTVASNKLSSTANGTVTYPQVYKNTEIPSEAGEFIFVKAIVELDNSVATAIQLNVRGSTATGGFQIAQVINNPQENTKYIMSGIVQINATQEGNVRIVVVHTYPDAATANGKVLKIEGWNGDTAKGGVFAINLTAHGLASKTEEEINDMLANGYFEGFGHTEAVTINSCGKNLIKTVNGSITVNGVTITADGDKFTIDGTPTTGNARISIIDELIYISSPDEAIALGKTLPTVLGETYVFSATTVSGTRTGVDWFYIINDAGGGFAGSEIGGLGATQFNYRVAGAYFYLKPGSVYSNYVVQLQLKQGTEASTYEPYKESAPVKTTHTLRSVPTGVADRYFEKDGIVYHEQNVQEYTLKESDFSYLATEVMNVDYVVMHDDSFGDIYNLGVGDVSGDKMINSRTSPRMSITFDSVENVWKHYFNSSNWIITFPKGAYASTEDVKADLTGTIALYRLAEPIITPTDINPNLLTYKDGIISIETTGIIPEVYAEYPGNVAAQRDSNTERISTMLKNEDVSIPEYIEKEHDSQVFSVPDGAVEGFAKRIELKGMTLFNDIKGGDFQDTNNWIGHFAGISASNNILTLLATAQYGALRPVISFSMRIGNKYFVYAKVKADSAEIMLATPQQNIYHSGSGEYEELYDIVSVTSDYIDSEYCFQIRDNRTSGWTDVLVDGNKGLYVINLTALGLEDKTEDDVLEMIASGYFEGLKGTGAVTVNHVGKNLADLDKLVSNDVTLQDGCLVADSINYWSKSSVFNIKDLGLEVGSAYTFKALQTLITATQNKFISFIFIDAISLGANIVGSKNTNIIGNGYVEAVFVIPEGTRAINLRMCRGINESHKAIYSQIQLEKGTTATNYRPYKSSAPITIASVGHRLPNGVQDKVYTQNGKWYREQNVGIDVLQESDFIQEITGSIVQYIKIPNSSFNNFRIPASMVEKEGSVLIDGFFYEQGITINALPVYSYKTDINNVYLSVPLGTYPNLAAAQADLAGTKILYQLATPIITELTANPNLLVQEGGTIYLDVDGITPNTSIEYCKNKDAREEQNLIAKNVINNRLVDLSSTAINKGASLIGVKDIAGLTGSEVQTILESIKALLDTINISLTTHTGSENPHSNHVKGDMTIHVQSTEPAGAVDGDIWIDTSV